MYGLQPYAAAIMQGEDCGKGLYAPYYLSTGRNQLRDVGLLNNSESANDVPEQSERDAGNEVSLQQPERMREFSTNLAWHFC